MEKYNTFLINQRKITGEGPVAKLVDDIFDFAIKNKASDIHLEPTEDSVRIRLRIDGLLQLYKTIGADKHSEIISRIKVISGIDIAEKRIPQDGRLDYEFENRIIDLRISTLPTIRGEKIVVRILDKAQNLLNVEELNFSKENLESFKRLYSLPNGIVLVTGPTGSGKSTTLYAALSSINTEDKNIITIEDPVEYKLEGINQVAVNVKAGLTFANGLRSIVRQDPNIIMIGEIRDRETAEIAVQSALTGHLVFSTLHTNSAVGAVTRLLDMGLQPFLLANTVRGIVAQRLVRKICSKCSQAYLPDTLEQEFLQIDENTALYKGCGCKDCNFTGYKGRLAIQEVIPFDDEFAKMIFKWKGESELYKKIKERGMKTMLLDGKDKIIQGLTTMEELLKAVYFNEE